MKATVSCRTCGVEIPSDSPMGQCPKCLFGLGVAVADEPAPARTPRGFAGYELVRQIGRGGMGVVYEARQARPHRTVALKMILGGESGSPVMRRRFFLEAEAAARLDHPNIVPIYEVGEFEDQPFLSMKLVPGESLRKKMVRGELGLPKRGEGLSRSAIADRERAIARLIATLARAVHHAHAHHVVHRDLKPGNILFDSSDTPHLTDFGLAKILDLDPSGPSARTEMVGTPTYMSPEQIRADAVTPATDIFSLGVILYELLAGEPPFHGATRNETLRMIETEPPCRPRQRNRHLHKDLETICLKCLEKDSGNRYATAEALAEDLDRRLAGQPIKARPANPWLRLSRWMRRNPLGAALIVTLAVAFAAAIWDIRDKNEQRIRMEQSTLRKLTDELKQSWGDPSKAHVVITAGELASLQFHPWPDASGAMRLTLAVNITESPGSQAKAFGPLLEALQKRMSSLLRRRVLLDLKLCKISHLAFAEIVSGQSDFQRLGAVSYPWPNSRSSPELVAVAFTNYRSRRPRSAEDATTIR